MRTDNKVFLSLDLGTQGTKAAIVDVNGDVAASAFCENRFCENEEGEISLDPHEMVQGVMHAVRELLTGSGKDPREIACVSIVGMMAGIVGIGENWEPVTPYDTGLDKRCETSIREMQEMGEELVIALSGCPIIVAQGAKMYWWKTTHPEIFQKVKKFVPASTYIGGHMAGLCADEAYIDYTHIHLTCFADVKNNCWSPELLSLFDFPEEKLPRIVAPYDLIGKVTKEWEEATGLQAGTPIVAGCGDTAASSLGAGLVKKNMILDVAGTASVISACVDEYKPDTGRKILIFPRSVIPGLWTPFGFVLGGQTLSWYLEQVSFENDYSFAKLAREAAEAENDNLFFLPYFAGRICPSDARFSGHWIGLKFYHTRANLFRSIMESIAFEYRFYLERIAELFPEMKMEEVYTSAGGAKSPELSKIKADILQLPFITLKQKDTSHIAAAVIAGYGTGIFEDMGGAVLAMCEGAREEQIVPDEARREKYTQQYRSYLSVVDEIGKLHRKLGI